MADTGQIMTNNILFASGKPYRVKGKVRQAFRRIKAKGGNQRPREDVGTLREEG